MSAAAGKPQVLLQRFVMLSAGWHLFVFTTTGVWGSLYSPPQFAVEVAPTSVDVTLVEEIPSAPRQEPLLVPEPAQPDDLPQAKAPEPPKEVPGPVVSDPMKGAMAEAKPDYLRNPAPVYPREARRRGWEGLVTLKVEVTPEGIPSLVTVEQSSGHVILDETAAKTVRAWQFFPARLGNVPVASSVRVPVRFEFMDSHL
ncbi:MAG: hypothetical protein A3G91_00420 [Omnitrophica WOR_2 bacterium RIFCSPLOWO2_12_FULL_50_9]|nr:MAG: hypothetical protein A3D87_02470 [Omnitrophica WOR_2 bacterium RIFCSPHIGHO2_02_FULL_50_17]OGX40577.1 MAG: hypothetical protein A3G91_00420 [Omnitrophica WOR_2 bacterium RIFCSPLOWO2_12_FULL_50_9]